jgi:periplasmic divalent cation tolerance protein
VKTLLVYVTVADREQAELIAGTLVEKHLAACCNIIPGISSIYYWQGRVNTDSELLLLIKTTSEKYELLEREILALHSYDVPEVIAVKIDAGSEKYIKWIQQTVEESDESNS